VTAIDSAPAAITCSALPPEKRLACRRQEARALQRQWLTTLAWGNGTISAEQAARIQLWLGIFPVNWRQLSDPSLLEQQLTTIRRHQSGSYAALLSAMVLDPALQLSLNGPANHRRNPNENLARELLELFSLGEGHYCEADVREAARALSGYRLSANRQLELDPRRHDPGPKTILGHCIHLSGSERAKLRDSGSIIAHCPTSNLFLRSGIMPWDTIANDGIPFGLASDVAGGPELSMWRVMRCALESQIARSFTAPCRIPSPAEIFHQSTQGAAEALGKGSQLGTLDPGKEGDAVLLDLAAIIPSGKNPPPPESNMSADDLLPLLIHRAGPESTLATLAAGRKVYSQSSAHNNS
jgi:hypothetical protein